MQRGAEAPVFVPLGTYALDATASSDYDAPRPALRALVALALAEDQGLLGDITSLACIDEDQKAEGAFVAREAGVLAGVEAASEVYRQVDRAVALDWDVTDGSAIAAGTTLGRLRGSMRSVLLGRARRAEPLVALLGDRDA